MLFQSKYEDSLRRSSKSKEKDGKAPASNISKLQRYGDAWNLIMNPIADQLRPLLPDKVRRVKTRNGVDIILYCYTAPISNNVY